MNRTCNTPVLFIIFNRPNHTQKVFECIRNNKPSKLFIAADGPRTDHADDVTLCKNTRKIIEQIDWSCEVITLFSDVNLGCKVAVSNAITWFFKHVDEGIILEDDCLPSDSFFEYCESLLKQYRTDKRVMLISGYNRQGIWKPHENDYFFSNLGGIWGWATWKRAWDLYDIEMKNLESYIKTGYFTKLLGPHNGKIREMQFNEVMRAKTNTWDYQWAFTRHIHKGIACVPSKNLIKNIGFGIDATHTTNKEDDREVALHELTFPIKKRDDVCVDAAYDELFFDDIQTHILSRILGKIKGFFSRYVK